MIHEYSGANGVGTATGLIMWKPQVKPYFSSCASVAAGGDVIDGHQDVPTPRSRPFVLERIDDGLGGRSRIGPSPRREVN